MSASTGRGHRSQGTTVQRTNFIARTTALAAGLSVAGLLGCGGREPGAMTADLERDLDLALNARRPQTVVVSAIEGGPRDAPSGTERGRRDAVPVPRRQPRPMPSVEEQETAVTQHPEEASAPAVAVTEPMEPAPTPAPTPAATEPTAEAAAEAAHPPEPAPEHETASRGPSASTGEAADGHGDGARGQGRRGGGWGTLIGVIIRGGAAGIDRCEAHDRRRTGRRLPGGRGGDILGTGGGGLGGVIGGVIANGGIRPTFPRY